jgi:hypothetical protein
MSGMPEFTVVRSFSLSVPYFKTFLNLAGGSKTRFTNVLSALQPFLWFKILLEPVCCCD